ncbi:BA75_00587T0 [Komagataella pastoris]|uniref:BA75_00587T0 n=1 Tax=Komagataella pastoris TaxID=4922 RepID=A0A1B2J739_PICPA|nr:BA75_00587T0 [Komagataella pastoris]
MTKPSFREQMKGFPIWQIFVLGMVRFAEPITFTSMFPYVFFMVRDFHIAPDEAHISKYCGYLSASFAFFQFLCSIHLGRLADVIGRKKVLMIGILGTTFSILVFGFSTSFWMALFARSFMGAVNGNVAVIRTVLGEVATNPYHAPLAFSTLPLLWQLGCVIGPMSGHLVKISAEEYTRSTYSYQLVSLVVKKSFLDSLVKKYPYCLPNIVVSVFLIFSLVFGALFLEETHHTLKDQRDYLLDIGDSIRNLLGFDIPQRPWRMPFKRGGSLVAVPSEADPLLGSTSNEEEIEGYHVSEDDLDDDDLDDETSTVGKLYRTTSANIMRTFSNHSVDVSGEMRRNNESGYPWHVLLEGKTFNAITQNFILCFTAVVFDEFLPVFLAYDVVRDKDGNLASKFPFLIAGGMGLQTPEIGTLLSTTGAAGVLVVLFIYPWVDITFNRIKALQSCLILTAVAYFAVPFLVFTLPPNMPQAVSTTLLYSTNILKTLASSLAFPQVILLIHRVSPREHSAFVNGTTLSLTALARALGPFIWGYVVSISVNHEIVWLSWVLLAAVAFVGFYLSHSLKGLE